MPKHSSRVPNARGQGARLRGEILAAARRILERDGVEEAVTLRATAREAGVTAPALYAHFSGREEIVEAVIGVAFAELADALGSAMSGIANPVRRLRAGCEAYVRFGIEQPATYRVLFTRHQPSELPSVAGAAAGVFQVLVDTIAECAAAGRSSSVDARLDAVGLWIGMHGLTALPPAHPRFPWPDRGLLLDQLLERLALLV